MFYSNNFGNLIYMTTENKNLIRDLGYTTHHNLLKKKNVLSNPLGSCVHARMKELPHVKADQLFLHC